MDKNTFILTNNVEVLAVIIFYLVIFLFCSWLVYFLLKKLSFHIIDYYFEKKRDYRNTFKED